MKPIWIPVVFVAGLAFGVLLGRSLGRDAPTGQVDGASRAASPSALAAHVAPAAGATATAPTVVRGASAAPAPVREATVISAEPPEASAAMDESAPAQPIDVGPVFRSQFAVAKKGGFRDQTAETHAALEREVRDDSWSYPLEADIQNSLVSDTSTGNFKAEHVECRSSLCEIRLSGAGDEQAKALQKWTDAVHTQPWGSRIYMQALSTISDNGRTDVLMLLSRPPKTATSN